MTNKKQYDACHATQTAKGWEQAVDAGEKLKALLQAESKGRNYRLFMYTSPYLRCKQASSTSLYLRWKFHFLVGCSCTPPPTCAASRSVEFGR